MQSARGLILEVEGGGVYALDTIRSTKKLVGQRVTIDGTRSGFDRVDVDAIRPGDA